MVRTVYVLVTYFFFAHGYRLPVKVYEIRKTRDQDSRVDVQYYDPDLERVSLPNKYNNRNIDNLANYIMKSLQHVSSNNDDNKSYDEYSEFVDETRSLPVVIVPDNRIVYHRKPRDYRILHKLLHSALRTSGVEDRTSAPRHRGNYDDYK